MARKKGIEPILAVLPTIALLLVGLGVIAGTLTMPLVGNIGNIILGYVLTAGSLILLLRQIGAKVI